jgi:hypothetical protein
LRSASGSRPDAGEAAPPDGQPPASLEGGDAPRLTNVAVEDLLLRPSTTIDYARLKRW